MIIKASQRTGARNLANHLMNIKDNDHVTIGEVRGVIGRSLHAVFLEIDASRHSTRCEKPFFSASFNPPKGETVNVDDFERAFNQLERKLGLDNQPRVVVYHEKEARRHAHVVWSRIDVDNGKAIHMSHFKHKCSDISRQLYREHGWAMPDGFKRKQDRDPFNVSVSEWQCLKRQSIDPRDIKGQIQVAFKRSDGLKGFKYALEEKGLFLAQGDKRGFVAIDHHKNVYSLSRVGGIKAKDLKVSLGTPESLPNISQTNKKIRTIYNNQALEKIAALKLKHEATLAPVTREKKEALMVQRAERRELKERQKLEIKAQVAAGKLRYSNGFKRIFDLVSGRRKRIQLINQKELALLEKRQAKYRDQLTEKHLKQSEILEDKLLEIKVLQRAEREQLASVVRQLHRNTEIQKLGRNVNKGNYRHEKVLSRVFEKQAEYKSSEVDKSTRKEKKRPVPKLKR